MAAALLLVLALPPQADVERLLGSRIEVGVDLAAFTRLAFREACDRDPAPLTTVVGRSVRLWCDARLPGPLRERLRTAGAGESGLRSTLDPESLPGGNPWLEDVAPQMQQPVAAPETHGAPRSASGSHVVANIGPASLLDLVNQSFEVMQTSLAQYKIAGYPPDILINVPKRVCRFFEFHKAPELIMLGRQIANDTLDKYEREHG